MSRRRRSYLDTLGVLGAAALQNPDALRWRPLGWTLYVDGREAPSVSDVRIDYENRGGLRVAEILIRSFERAPGIDAGSNAQHDLLIEMATGHRVRVCAVLTGVTNVSALGDLDVWTYRLVSTGPVTEEYP